MSLIGLCADEQLQSLALAFYILENDFLWLLLESEPYSMQYLINKELSLRQMMGEPKFKGLIKIVSEKI